MNPPIIINDDLGLGVALPLTNGGFAIISPEDFKRCSQFRWCSMERGYIRRSSPSNPPLTLHTLVMGPSPHGLQPDHRNRRKHDCRRQNLRWATDSQNRGNVAKRAKPASSIYRGVSRHRGRWAAALRHEGENYWIGSFDREDDAAIAYDLKAIAIWGEFAYLNKPNLLPDYIAQRITRTSLTPPPRTRPCDQCAEVFVLTQPHRRFCSVTCQKRYNNLRH